MINTVTLVGRLTKNPELQRTPNNNTVCQFTLAVNRRKPDDPTDFVQCVAWNKSAENLCQYMSKGSLIGLTGRIQTRTYENKQGQTVYVTEVMTNDIVFLEPRKQNNAQNQYQQPQYQQNNYAQNEPQYEPQSKVLDIDSDDLPF